MKKIVYSLLFYLFYLLETSLYAEVVHDLELNDDLSKESLLLAIDQSLKFIEKQPKGAIVFDKKNISRKVIYNTLFDLRKKLDEFGLSAEFYKYFNNHYKLHDISGCFKLTGYYEAELEASYERTERFSFPIYKEPLDLVSVKKQGERYFTREEIDFFQALENKDLEIMWTDDRIKLFFLHIQGSGKMRMRDGSIVDIQYANDNGYDFKGIAKILFADTRFKRDRPFMQGVMDYFDKYPNKMAEILSYNPRYIFFKHVKNGPIGSLGERLTPKRSIALDQRYFPLGALLVLQATEPVINSNGKLKKWHKFTRFVLNQDSGNAIKGLKRADYFMGTGKLNEIMASQLYQDARMAVVLPKE